MTDFSKTHNVIRTGSAYALAAMIVGVSLSLVGCRSFYDRALPPLTAGPPALGLPAVEGIDPVMIAPENAPANPGIVVGGQNTSQLVLAPQSIVAPVGSEVVLLATVADASGLGTTRQRVEWMLSPDSVGQLVALGDSDGCWLFGNSSNKPRKVTNSFAVGSTSRTPYTLGRGTPTPADDVAVQPGQAWVTVSSATDGTSHVTAFAPQVPAWDLRKRTAIIYWVDAQFSFPAPAIAAVGTRQTFTTIVTRSSDGSALENYLVSYQVADDGIAGFSPAGATAVEVPTDAEGRATVEIFQRQPQRGEIPIQVEIIRPAGVATAADRRLVIGRGTTMMTWTAPAISLRATGPAEAAVGSTATYRFEITNSGDLPLNDVVMSNRVPAELQYERSTVAAERSANGLEWRLDQLAAGQSGTVDVSYQVIKAGAISNCVSVTTAEQVRAEDCASTNVALAGLGLDVSGPTTATVGEQVTFNFSITNRSGAALKNLIVIDRYDDGLRHAVAESPIERDLGPLAAGQTRDDIYVTFDVVRAGRHCQTVEIAGEGVQPARRTICITATEAVQQSPAALQVQKQGPRNGKVGDTLLYQVVVTNTGGSPLRNVKVVDTYGRGLKPTRVSDGFNTVDDQLIWRFDELKAGESETLQVEVKCSEVAQACTRVTVTADGDLVAADEVCARIDPVAQPPLPIDPPKPDNGEQPPVLPPGDGAEVPADGDVLSVTMSDLRDEIAVGSKVVYEVIVTNRRDVADTNVVVMLTVPEGLSPIPGAVGVVAPSNPVVTGRVVRFNPVAEIRPRERLIFRIPVRADQAGQYRSQIRVTSDGQRRPLIATEDSSVFKESQ